MRINKHTSKTHKVQEGKPDKSERLFKSFKIRGLMILEVSKIIGAKFKQIL
jgi:hypothetical protein